MGPRPIKLLPSPLSVRDQAFRFLLGRGVQDHDSEDLAQEVVVKFLRYRDRIRPAGARGWVRMVALNALRDHVNRERRIPLQRASMDAQPSRTDTGSGIYDELLERLPRALEALGHRRAHLEPSANKVARFRARARIRRLLGVAS